MENSEKRQHVADSMGLLLHRPATGASVWQALAELKSDTENKKECGGDIATSGV